MRTEKVTRAKVATDFPKLMEGLSGAIYIILGSNTRGCYTGTCIHQGESKNTVGEFSESWSKANLHDFNGKIIIDSSNVEGSF